MNVYVKEVLYINGYFNYIGYYNMKARTIDEVIAMAKQADSEGVLTKSNRDFISIVSRRSCFTYIPSDNEEQEYAEM